MDGMAHSLPGNVILDLQEAIDRRVADGRIPPSEREATAVHIEERLMSQMDGARFRHPVRLMTRGR